MYLFRNKHTSNSLLPAAWRAVCVYIYIHIYIGNEVRRSKHVCMYVPEQAYIELTVACPIETRVRVYIHTYIHTSKCMCVYACMHEQAYIELTVACHIEPLCRCRIRDDGLVCEKVILACMYVCMYVCMYCFV